MEKDGRVILELLQNKEYVTAEALADAMKLSIKTVRLRIKSLNETGRGERLQHSGQTTEGILSVRGGSGKMGEFFKKRRKP